MFDPTSRYSHLRVLRHPAGDSADDGVAYVARRFIPAPDDIQAAATIVVRSADRSDHLSTTAYGDPTQFWRISDANRALHADEVAGPVGRRIVIPVIGPPPVDESADRGEP